MNKGKILVAAAVASFFGFGLVFQASAEVTITATPGTDFKGTTVTVSGADTSVTPRTLSVAVGSQQLEVEGTVSGNDIVFTGTALPNAGAKVNGTVTIGTDTYGVRLNQGAVTEAASDLFSTKAALTVVTASGGSWNTTPTASEGKMIFTDDTDDASVFSLSSTQQDRQTVVELDLLFDATLNDDTVPDGAQAAVRIVGEEAPLRFAYLVDGAWQTNTTEEVTLNTAYNLRATLDYVSHRICYEVKGASDSAYTTLYDGWSSTVSAAMASVSFAGCGKLSEMDGDQIVDTLDSNLCKIGDNEYATVAEAAAAGDAFTLLWNASWQPTTSDKTYTITGDGHQLVMTTTGKDGIAVSESEGTYTVKTGYYEAGAEVNGTYTPFTYLTGALAECDANSTNVLLRDANVSAAVALDKDVCLMGNKILSNGVYEVTGAGLTTGTGKLTILSGYIGVDALGDNTTLKGGRYKANVSSKVASGYAWTTLAVEPKDGYAYQVVEESLAPTAAQEVLPVKDADGNDAGSIVLNKDWVIDKTGTSVAADQVTALNAKQSNNLTMWENAVLGLENKAGNIPVVTPVQSTSTSAGKIKFSLGNVAVDTDSGATVQYRVMQYAKLGDAIPEVIGASTAAGDQAEMSLPSDGVKYYRIDVEAKTSK